MSRPQKLHDSLPSLWRILHAFWPRIRRQRSLVLGSLITLLISVGLKLLEPWPLKWVFDHILKSKNVANRRLFDDFLATLDSTTLLGVAVGSLIVVTALRALAEYLSSVGFALVGNRVLTEVRNDLYRQLQRLSLGFHSKARGGDLTVRVVGDVNMLKDVAATAMLPLAANVLILLGMAVLMLWLEWRLATLALLTLPLYWLTTSQLTRRIREASRKQRAREGEMASAAAESLAAVKDLQALSLEPVFAEQFTDRSQKCQTQNVVTARLSASLERRVDVLGAFATALVLFFGVRMAVNEQLSAGDLLIFLAYLKRSYNPLQDLAKYTGRLAKAAAAGERVLDILNRTPEVCDLPGAVPAPPFRGEISFEKLSFAYEAGHPVLRDVDFRAVAGEQIAIVGPSGIGKSTLLNLVLRLYDPHSGRVLIDGQELRSLTLASLRSQISVVLQDGLLFAATVRDNVSYTRSCATQEEVEAAARLANAHEFIERLPQGYDTILGERGVTLSHGQRQRIAIARAAIRNAPILILDEPTTGLDEENERAVVGALRRLAQGRTTLLVTHDLRLAARADQILVLNHGEIAERGSHADLLASGGWYATLYRLQTGNDDLIACEVSHALAR